jgi:AbrB family looped-hinge helix DNA binding protein
MSTATITSKGQITIPADVRERLGLQAGDRIEFVQIGPNEFSFIPATRSIKELCGLLKVATKGGASQ